MQGGHDELVAAGGAYVALLRFQAPQARAPMYARSSGLHAADGALHVM